MNSPKMIINHIGIIVDDINKSMNIYSKLDYVLVNSLIDDYYQNNRIAIMQHEILPTIELIQPINNLSSIINFSKGYHHICYESSNGIDIVKLFITLKIGKIFTKPMIAPALDNRQVVFACLTDGSFIELIL